VNDIAVLGAEPLSFWITRHGQLEPHVLPTSSRFARGARKTIARSSAARRAQMPGFYQAGEYDLSGTMSAWWKNPDAQRPENHPARRRVSASNPAACIRTAIPSAQNFLRAVEIETVEPRAGIEGTIGEELLKVM